MGAGFGLGFILGPALGGLVAGYGPEYPFLVSAGLNLMNFLFGLLILPESLPASLRRDFSWRDLNPFKSLYVLAAMPAISLLVIAHVLIQLCGQTHPSIWAIYTETRFGWTPAQVGLSLAVVGVLSALAQGVMTGPLVKKFGEKKVSLWGTLGEAFGFAGYGLATTGAMVYGVLGISSVFWAAQPALQSLISREIPPDKQGELQGALMSLMSMTAVVNPLIMTRIFAMTSIEGGYIHVPGMPYYIAALLGFGAFIAIWKWERSH